MGKFCQWLPQDTDKKLYGGVVTYILEEKPETGNIFLYTSLDELMQNIESGNFVLGLLKDNIGDAIFTLSDVLTNNASGKTAATFYSHSFKTEFEFIFDGEKFVYTQE